MGGDVDYLNRDITENLVVVRIDLGIRVEGLLAGNGPFQIEVAQRHHIESSGYISFQMVLDDPTTSNDSNLRSIAAWGSGSVGQIH